MTGFLHYFLNSIDPRSVVGLFNALPRLLTSAYLPFWIFGVLPIVRFVFPSVGCWLVYAVRIYEFGTHICRRRIRRRQRGRCAPGCTEPRAPRVRKNPNL